MSKRLLFAFFGILFSAAHAQDLASSRKTSFYTYIFKITEAEARQIYRKDLDAVTDAFFHTVVDSFPTGKTYPKPLRVGHYLFAFAQENELRYELQSADYLQVKLLNNKNDLAVHLHDSLGRLVTDARVFVRKTPIPYNAKTRSYRLKNAHRRGLLAVTYRGFTSYHVVTPKQQTRRGVLALKKIAFGRPGLGYVTMPFWQVYASIRYKSSQGWVRRITQPFHSDWWYRTFDRDEIDERRGGRFTRRHRGYIAFDKPRYQPRDTVRFKALLLTRKGKPIASQPVEVFLAGDYRNPKRIKLATLKPYARGGYEYKFFLHDSLKLKLGTHYRIVLENAKEWEYLGEGFKYEDYELKTNTFTIRSDRKDYYKGTPPVLYAKGTDENDLNVLDARVRLTVLPGTVRAFTDRQVLVPDTLWQHEQKLDAVGETKITLPDSLFPNAEMQVTVQAVFLNAGNEQHRHTVHSTTHYQTDELRLSLVRDSLVAEYFRAGKSVVAEAELTGSADYENDVENFRKTVSLPYREAVNPYTEYYVLEAQNLRTSLDLGESSADLQVFTDRSADSVWVQVTNPRRLPFWYTVYRKNARLAAGSGNADWDWKWKTTLSQKYFVSLQYGWANKMREEEYEIPLPNKQLRIQTDQPTTVSPGATVPIRVEIRDVRNQPVANADVTAYGVTKKFPELRPPTVPDFSKNYPNRLITSTFELNKKFDPDEGETESRRKLQWERWHREMGLDSIAYFQFLYPKNGVYRHYLPMPNLTTQIAPFVVLNGKIEPVHMIFLDEEPIYFQVADVGQRYSFHADTGYHRLHLRTRTLGIRLDSVYLRKGQKLIISVAPAPKTPIPSPSPIRGRELSRIAESPSLTGRGWGGVQPLKPGLSPAELGVLNNYLMPVRRNFGGGYTYLKQGKRVFYLDGGGSYQKPSLIGPIKPTAAQFVMKDVYTTDFTFEPGFEYDFSANLLKMRTWQGYKTYKLPYLPQKIVPNFRARAWTAYELDSLRRGYREIPKYTREEYNNPYHTSPPNGEFNIRKLTLDGKSLHNVKYFVLFSETDTAFFRVYPGGTSAFHHLPAGSYRLVILLYFNKYVQADKIRVGKNAVTYLNLDFDAVRAADAFSEKIAKTVVEKITVRVVTTPPAEPVNPEPAKKKASVPKRVPRESLWRDADFNTYVEGRVFDDNGDALPGVSVSIKGTNRGTTTNMDGFYQIYAPSDAVLVFSFIGFVTQEFKISKQQIDVQLQSDIQSLQEVVVVGYGSEHKKDVTGSVVTVSSALQGKAAGVVVTQEGGVIRIRGMGSLPAANRPLMIVDGKIYEGSEIDPTLIASAEILKDAAATAVYGSRGANGVIIITTKNSISAKAKTLPTPEFTSQVTDNQIRSRFSDYAYWQPRLRTDKNGTVTFNATFPDDITNWRTFVIAAGNRKTGVAEGSVKAFKTLSGNLAVPRFLVQGDTAQVIGKALNYSADTVLLQTTFEVNSKIVSQQKAKVHDAHIDSATVTAAGLDSLKIKYFIQKTDGYADGEMRPVPVFAKGVSETQGVFVNLEKDTTLRLAFDPKLGNVQFYARADVLDILLDEIGHLKRYEYLCNEQTASKLKAYLLEKRIRTHLSQPFAYDEDVNKLVRKLTTAQKKEGAWGWWQDTPVAVWVSVHVAEALLQAEEMGYETAFDKRKFTDYFVFQVEREKDFDDKLRMLKILKKLGANVDFARHVRQLDSLTIPPKPVIVKNKLGYTKTIYPTPTPPRKGGAFGNAAQPPSPDGEDENESFRASFIRWAGDGGLRLNDYLNLLEFKQMAGFTAPLDTIWKYQQTTLFGNRYWGETSYHPYQNEVQTTLAVYRILKAKSGYEKELASIRNYFLERRQPGHWRNTYESARILETILPDVLGKEKTLRPAELTIQTGGETKTVKQFPFAMEANPNSSLEIHKTGSLPVYVTAYQRFQNTNPAPVDKDFAVKTTFKGQNATQQKLKAGETVTLRVDLEVKKDADYMLVEVPIPAGCSYADNLPNHWMRSGYETYREQFRHKTAIYCTKLSRGRYAFEINLVPRFAGTYTLNPAKAELMYFPTFFGRNAMQTVRIKP